METLLVCGFGSGMDRSLAEVRAMGVRLLVLTDEPTPLVVQNADLLILADPADQESALAAARTAGVTELTGVVSLGCDNPPVVARLAERYGCPGISEQAAADCTDKTRRIRIFARAGLPVARHQAAADLPGALAALRHTGLPAVVKPVDRTGSIGVARIDEEAGAPALIQAALAASRNGQVLVEEYLTGTEHTVAGLVSRGRFTVSGFSDREYRKTEFGPHFFEEGDTMPTALPRQTAAKVVSTLAEGIEALGLTDAVINSDILVTSDGRVFLLEVTARLTGARIATEVMPLGTGARLLPNVIRQALGRPLELSELQPRWNRAVVQRFLPATAGIVQEVGELPQVTDPSVHDLFWCGEMRLGAVLPGLGHGCDALAGTIVTGRTPQQADEAARALLARLPVRIGPLAGSSV